MKAIVNGKIYTPTETLLDHAILLKNGKVLQVLPTSHVAGLDLEVIDARGLAVTPGLLDIHTYGCLGVQLTEPDRIAEELAQLARNVARYGVTGFLISPPVGDRQEITARLSAIANAISRLQDGAHCLGIHLEGPYLERGRKGAFPEEVLRHPDLNEIEEWLQAGDGHLRIVTLAPGLPGAEQAARFLASQGVIPSLGHTDLASEPALQALPPRGLFALVTHIFNAMSGLHQRDPGTAVAALLSDVPLMLICDGLHVHPHMVQLLYRLRGANGVILVTDANAGAGLGDGEFELFNRRVIVKGGRATLEDGTLVGSVLTLNRALERLRAFTGLPFNEALQMSALNPARLLRLDAKGFIGANADADLVFMDEESGEVFLTMVAGKIAFNRETAQARRRSI